MIEGHMECMVTGNVNYHILHASQTCRINSAYDFEHVHYIHVIFHTLISLAIDNILKPYDEERNI